MSQSEAFRRISRRSVDDPAEGGRRNKILIFAGVFLVIMFAAVGYIMAGDTISVQETSFPPLKDLPQIGRVVAAESGNQPSYQALRIGDPAPNFSFLDPSGKARKLSDYKGQAVLINFWATWCPYCVKEMPDIEAVYREQQDKGFIVLGINLDDDAGAARKFLQLRGITFPSVQEADSVAVDLYRVQPIPASFFIDRNGILRDIQIGAMTKGTVKAKVNRIL